MKKMIFKYPLEIVEQQWIEMPFGSVIIDAKMQLGSLVLWAIVDCHEKSIESRGIYISGTGNELHANESTLKHHISTVYQGIFVWHIFECKFD